MRRRPPRSTRNDTLFPYTTLCRSLSNLPVGKCVAQNSAYNGTVSDRLPILNKTGVGVLELGMKVEDVYKFINKEQIFKVYTYDANRRKRSEEHTSELQSLMRISYAVFCLKKKNNNKHKAKIT